MIVQKCNNSLHDYERYSFITKVNKYMNVFINRSHVYTHTQKNTKFNYYILFYFLY